MRTRRARRGPRVHFDVVPHGAGCGLGRCATISSAVFSSCGPGRGKGSRSRTPENMRRENGDRRKRERTVSDRRKRTQRSPDHLQDAVGQLGRPGRRQILARWASEDNPIHCVKDAAAAKCGKQQQQRQQAEMQEGNEHRGTDSVRPRRIETSATNKAPCHQLLTQSKHQTTSRHQG